MKECVDAKNLHRESKNPLAWTNDKKKQTKIKNSSLKNFANRKQKK
jgi:hypothetical protein